MNRRDAKRVIAGMLAETALDLAREGVPDEAGDDAERMREAAFEFAGELYRRAGVDREARVVDERQVTIYEALEQVDG